MKASRKLEKITHARKSFIDIRREVLGGKASVPSTDASANLRSGLQRELLASRAKSNKISRSKNRAIEDMDVIEESPEANSGENSRCLNDSPEPREEYKM